MKTAYEFGEALMSFLGKQSDRNYDRIQYVLRNSIGFLFNFNMIIYNPLFSLRCNYHIELSIFDLIEFFILF